MSRLTLSAEFFLLIDFCLIFVPFGHYDEAEILPYENPSMYSTGVDLRQSLPPASFISMSYGDHCSVIKIYDQNDTAGAFDNRS